MTGIRVGVRKLKSRLGEYLRRVQAGEIITVTERGRAVGQIVPVQPTLEKHLHGVAASGLAEWDGRKYRPQKPVARNRSRWQLSDLIVENRGDDPPL